MKSPTITVLCATTVWAMLILSPLPMIIPGLSDTDRPDSPMERNFVPIAIAVKFVHLVMRHYLLPRITLRKRRRRALSAIAETFSLRICTTAITSYFTALMHWAARMYVIAVISAMNALTVMLSVEYHLLISILPDGTLSMQTKPVVRSQVALRVTEKRTAWSVTG